jgi:hypothetical protein
LLHAERRTSERHNQAVIGSRYQLNQPAVGTIARLDDRPGISAGQGASSSVETKTTTLLCRSMTQGASLFENGLNIARKLYVAGCPWRLRWNLVLPGASRELKCKEGKQQRARESKS